MGTAYASDIVHIHHREALKRSIALQQSSTAAKRVEEKSALPRAGRWMLAGFPDWPDLLSALGCINCELLPAIFQNDLGYYIKTCTSAQAKILPAVMRRTASNKGKAWDLLLGYPGVPGV